MVGAMKLRYTPASPFVRKVLVCAIEAGLRERLELVPTVPWDPNTDLSEQNPLGKVPALVTEEAGVLYDSRVICEYLDGLAGGGALFPESGARRLTALRRQALADGILDAAVLRVNEGRRPEGLRSAEWDARQRAKVARGLDALEAEVPGFGDLDIGLIAAACVPGYLDFRYPHEEWRSAHPALAAWYEGMAQRPSLVDTVHRDPASADR
jgi:glutathione S-transferase